MVELARFATPVEAEMAVSLLQAEGIDSYVRDAIASQVFMGYADIGSAKVELLAKDLERAREIMRDHGYDVSEAPDETPDAECGTEYLRDKARFSKTMTLIIVCLLAILALLIILNRFYG